MLQLGMEFLIIILQSIHIYCTRKTFTISDYLIESDLLNNQYTLKGARRQRFGQPERAFERGVWYAPGGPSETKDASTQRCSGMRSKLTD